MDRRVCYDNLHNPEQLGEQLRSMSESKLSELEAVLAVARHGGFRAAAKDLGMSSSALSHAISGLESRLGVRLFNHTTRSVALTDAGEQLVNDIDSPIHAIRAAVERVGTLGTEPTGVLRINSTTMGGSIILRPIVAR
jgi:DNA-binding transcriptional LysR family regulator